MLKKINKKISKDVHFSELISGSSVSFIFQILGLLLGYIVTIIITQNFGASSMGLFVLSLTILQIFSILGRLGMGTVLVRLNAKYFLNNDWYSIKDTYYKVMLISLTFSFFLAIIIYSTAAYIAENIFSKLEMLDSIQLVAIILLPHVGFFLTMEAYRGIKEIRIYSLNKNLIINLFSSLFLLLALLFTFANTTLPLLVYMLSLFISFLILSFLWNVRLKKELINEKNTTSKKTYREILNLSLPMLISSSFLLIIGWTDIIMLGIFSTESDVGIYSVVMKVASIASIALIAINSIAAPKFSELWSNNDNLALEKIVQQSTKLIFITSFPILVIIFLFPSYLLSLFGEVFITGTLALIILAFGQFISSISGSVGYFFQMTNGQKIFKNIVLISAIINLVLNYILIPLYGLNGAAISTTISLIFWNLTSVVYIKQKHNLLTIYFPVISNLIIGAKNNAKK